ncbi:MAG: ribose 5-phosphate isomerase B [Magnetococcales bacterium]|nr:ribose 5-phosphate isomerase B [Magnetococcales bacterium]
MVIAIANDHGGTVLKQQLLEQMERNPALEIMDLGTDGVASVDYPEYAKRVCTALLSGEAQRGVLICGTGLGMSMAANRYSGIRAALCHDEYTARLSRQHNDANILVLGARTIGSGVAAAVLEVWLKEPFEGGRHQRRISQMDAQDELSFAD